MEGVAEVKEGRGHLPEGTRFPREDAFAKPPTLESKKASLGSHQLPGPGPGNHWVHAVDSRALSRTAYPLASSTKLGSSVPGRQAQDGGSHESLQTVSASSLQQSPAEPSALHQAQKPTSFSTEGWVPTPPSSRKTTSPVSRRKAALARPCRQGEPVDPPLPSPRSGDPRTCELSPAQTQPCGPPVRHPLLALSTNNCNNSMPLRLQESPGGAGLEGKVEEGPCSQELPAENGSSHGKQRPQARCSEPFLTLHLTRWHSCAHSRQLLGALQSSGRCFQNLRGLWVGYKTRHQPGRKLATSWVGRGRQKSGRRG